MQTGAGTIMNQLQAQPVSIQMQNPGATQVNAPAVSMATAVAGITAVASPSPLQPVAGSPLPGMTTATTATQSSVTPVAQVNGALHIGSQITCMPVDVVKDESKVSKI